MKFIHCADLHLESAIKGIPTDKSKIRREEVIRAFERLCDYAEKTGVTAIIIAGDMFDTAKVSIKTRERVTGCILSHKAIDFLYLSGNHDEDNFISSLEEVPENLKVFGNKWTSFRYGDTVISGIRSDAFNGDTLYDTLRLDKDDVNIVTMHGQVVGYSSNESAENISLPLLKDKYIDYLALGHIHYHDLKPLDERGVYAYSGCLEGRGFDETGEKGFYLLEVDNKRVKAEFIPFAARELHELIFTVDADKSFYDVKREILVVLKKECDRNDLIKVILKGEIPTDYIVDINGLLSMLSSEFFFVKVVDKTTLKISEEDVALDKSVKGEFVRLVLNSDMDSLMKNKVIMCGINALKGEEI